MTEDESNNLLKALMILPEFWEDYNHSAKVNGEIAPMIMAEFARRKSINPDIEIPTRVHFSVAPGAATKLVFDEFWRIQDTPLLEDIHNSYQGVYEKTVEVKDKLKELVIPLRDKVTLDDIVSNKKVEIDAEVIQKIFNIYCDLSDEIGFMRLFGEKNEVLWESMKKKDNDREKYNNYTV